MCAISPPLAQARESSGTVPNGVNSGAMAGKFRLGPGFFLAGFRIFSQRRRAWRSSSIARAAARTQYVRQESPS